MKNSFFLYLFSLLWCTSSVECISSAITWVANGGRFGDNLLSYSRAKWLSYTFHNIPVLCLPFKYSDQLMLYEKEIMYTHELAKQFTHVVQIPHKINYQLLPNSHILYISHWYADVDIDWSDADFVEEIKQNICPRKPLAKVAIPDNCLSIAVHVRHGGGFAIDNNQKEKERCPLRFVPDEFYIAQIARIADMFPDENLYVHIFTDHQEPKVLKKKFKKALNNPRITFGCRATDNHHDSNVLEDFFSMMDFEYLIRPGSHYSRFVQRLGDNKMVIYPESVKKTSDGKSVINMITIKTREYVGQKWKTQKITIA